MRPSPIGGVRDQRISHLLVPQPSEHRHLNRRDHLTCLVAQQRDAEDLISVSVDDGLPRADGPCSVLARGMAARASLGPLPVGPVTGLRTRSCQRERVPG